MFTGKLFECTTKVFTVILKSITIRIYHHIFFVNQTKHQTKPLIRIYFLGDIIAGNKVHKYK